MKRNAASLCVIASGLLATLMIHGCGNAPQFDEASIRRIAREEARMEREDMMASFAPETFGFGGALEQEWAHAQAVKTGNLIFVSGQQPYDTNLDADGMPLTDKETGQPFEIQLTTVLENIQTCLDHYGATMDDVVFLQAFVDERAGTNRASFNNAAAVITKFFPNARQAMTFVSVENLFGPEQLIEANAIAVVRKW